MDHDYIKKAPANKSRNTKYCCVPQCGTYGHAGISFHLFPKDIKQKKKWETALRMGKLASSAMRVCSRHFQASDYFPSSSKRHKLFPHVIPSQNIPKRSSEVPLAKKKKTTTQETRAESRHKRIVASQDLGQVIKNGKNYIQDGSETNISVNSSHHVMSSSTQAYLVEYRKDRPQEDWSIADILCDKEPLEKCTQINLLPIWKEERDSKQLTFSDLLSSDKHLFTFTGIYSFELLETLVYCVSELALDAPTNKKMLSVKDKVILTMVNIKQNMPFRAIGVLFGINRLTCYNYFNNMWPKLSRVLKVVIPWADIEMIRSNLPRSIQKCKNTRITLDCGYASDKHIVNESGNLNKCEFNDGVMVDKAYRIESENNKHLLQLIRLPLLSQNKLTTKEDAICTAEIAQARVHVERVIQQRLRQYKLLCEPLPSFLAPHFDDILNIVGGLTNLGPPIIHIDKFK